MEPAPPASPPSSKRAYPCLELLKHIRKSLTRRPDFAGKLPSIFIPSLELAPSQAPAGSWDLGLLQAADALMEIAFAVYAEANPNSATRGDTRTKELEILMARLYAEKRMKDEAQKSFKKALELQIKKHLTERKLLEDQIEELLQRLNRVQEDYELLQKETEEQAQAILAVSISSEGEPVARGLDETSSEIMTDSTTERGFLLGSQAPTSFPATPQEPASPPPPFSSSSPSPSSSSPSLASEVQLLSESSSQLQPPAEHLASTIPFSQLMRPLEASPPPPPLPQDQLQQQVSELERSLLISTDKVSKAMEVMDKIEGQNTKIHENVAEIIQHLKGFEGRLLARLEEFQVKLVANLNDQTLRNERAASEAQQLLSAASLPASEVRAAVGEYHHSVTGALGHIISELNKINTKFDAKEASQPVEAAKNLLSYSKLKEKKRTQMTRVSDLLGEVEFLLKLETPTCKPFKFKKIERRLRAVLAEVRAKVSPPAAEQADPQEAEKRRQLLASVQAAYSTILYLFKSLLKHARIVEKVAHSSSEDVPGIIHEKLPFPFSTSPLEVPTLLESLVQTTETFAPEVMIFLEDHLEILWQSQQPVA